MKKLNLIFPIVVIGFVGFFIGLGLVYYQYSATVMRFPVIIGGLAILFSALVISGILRRTEPHEDDPLESEVARSELGRFAVACLWLLGILPALYVLRFPLGVPVYVFVYMLAHGEKWLLSLAMAALGFAVTYFVFMEFLGVPLPAAPLGFS